MEIRRNLLRLHLAVIKWKPQVAKSKSMKPITLSTCAKLLALALSIQFLSSYALAQTPSSLWAEYVANPYNHPNIPNNSYAGYGTGIVPIPNPSYTVYDVTSAPYNAIPNDAIDDQPAIQAAIDAAGTAGSGIVFIPAGTYYLNKPLYLKYNNVILRGAGPTSTILDFRYSMYSMFKADIDAGAVGPGGLWWATGLIWIGPPNTFLPNGAPNMFTDYEHWRSTTTLATVNAVSNPGSFTISVASAASLSPGMRILIRYVMPADRSLIKEIHGHTGTKPGIDNNSYVGDCTNITSPGEQYYFYPAVIESISGTTVTLDRPLRLRIDPAQWATTIRDFDGLITESGVEDLQILGHNTTSMAHLPAPTNNATSGGSSLGGWNGVYINRSWNCWVDNVRFVNLECGVVFSAAKNCSALNTFVTSTASNRWYHHPYAVRVYSSDNLIEDFTIDGPSRVYHGINAEWYASGNVYCEGLMKVGTFDTHRASAFDLIRTEITVANDAGSAPGGATTSGPFAGKRFAHWNIIQQIQAGYTYQNGASRNGNDVNEPRQFPMGALVAITGATDNSDGEHVPPGDLGAVQAAGPITDPNITNLYHAQLALRQASTLPIKLISFEARRHSSSQVSLSWKVAEPTDHDRFILEWSKDGRAFTEIFQRTASSSEVNYGYLHAVIDWKTDQFYRLKIINDAGAISYSSIRKITREQAPEPLLILYPSPATDNLTIAISNINNSDIRQIRIVNAAGQVVKSIRKDFSQQTDVSISELAAGIYTVEVSTDAHALRKTFVKK